MHPFSPPPPENINGFLFLWVEKGCIKTTYIHTNIKKWEEKIFNDVVCILKVLFVN